MSSDLQLTRPEVVDTLTQRLLQFVHLARDNGYRVGVSEQLLVQQSIALIDPFCERQLRSLLRLILCSEKRDWHRFDELFNSFWHGERSRRQLKTAGTKGSALQLQTAADSHSKRNASSATQGDANQGEGEAEGAGQGYKEGASRSSSIEKVDFGSITDPEEMRRMEILIERLALNMRRRLSRRKQTSKRHGSVDLRRTMRRSLSTGGEPLALLRREARRRQPRMLLILDVSRSMSMYSFLMLRFARGIARIFRDVAVFAFHTHIVPITDALRQTSLARVRNSLNMLGSGWSGGTRIGESLNEFIQRYGSWMNSRTLTCILSDGYDTGDLAQLETALADIKQRGRNLLWINPLWQREGYSPEAKGMQVAMRFADQVAGAHNLETLRSLEPYFTRLA
ncbi:MAG: VWA domain-containing protein [Oceanospirillaceae bacterium]|nr:VWA domain-containing protein [Oceanospirillaceae bacterium]